MIDKLTKEIIDNSEGNKLLTFLIEILKAKPDTNLDIATAFFNIRAYAMLKDNLNGVKRFRLLLGKEPEIESRETLGEMLLKHIKEEVESLDLSKESSDVVKSFIEFLKRDNVEVRIYDKLHGKAYIFDDLIVVGSSNFTPAGLTRTGELNSVSLKSHAEYARREWFEKFWNEARDFKKELIALLEASRFGSKEYTPYEVFIKAIYELQKEDIKAEEELKKIPSRVELTEFQEDAIPRIKSRLKKYGGVLIADSVGLGKTWIAKKIIEEYGYYKRKNYLVICPAQLRERLWKKELKDLVLSENILSHEELASSNFLEKAKRVVGGKLDEIELIVVDESHNFRNPLTNRWENFVELYRYISKNGKPPKLIFLTATPMNNSIWDIYWQILLLVGLDQSAFAKENIPNLFEFFREVEEKGDPSLLNDLLNEISIRRTRDYIKKNYPNATINGKKITFPDRKLENISYRLDETYHGMYKEISDAITKKLTMACYQVLKYKKVEKLTQDENWNLQRMIALSGILKTILLKRLESSVEAFRISIKKHIRFLEEFKKQLKEGKLITKDTFNKYLMNIEEELEEFKQNLQNINLNEYKKDELFRDIDNDINVLSKILRKVETITPEKDSKLNTVKKYLLDLTEKGKIIVFTYYEDTLEYLFKNLKESKEFSKFRIEKISGKTSINERLKILEDFSNKKIDILISTDVLSEGENLQVARVVVNYDLHWNPTRMIQRAGRIDRIGSPYDVIFIYNVFPEDELEDLLRLVETLQTKIREIDKSIGLDQQILGEKIHPKVFGVIRRIKAKDEKVFEDLEAEMFGGGEKFYQPLKDFITKKGLEELDNIPNGIHSGLKKNKNVKGIFFYYKYLDDFHFWYLYDINSGKIIKNKSEIIDFISCSPEEKRVIPEFFERIYEINEKILKEIEKDYKKIEQRQKVDTDITQSIRNRATTFIRTLIREIEKRLEDYIDEYPGERDIEVLWDNTRDKLQNIASYLTKRQLKDLRKMWIRYKKVDGDWKKLIKDVHNFIKDIYVIKREELPPFDKEKLKLIVIDFVS